MPYDKPFKTYEEQHEKLILEYNLFSIDEKIEIEALKTLSYYNIINGYKEIFMNNGVFKSDVTIIDIVNFSIFEKMFLTTLFKYSTYVEEIFKVKLAYTISKNISVDHLEYFKTKYYHIPPKRYSKFIDTIDKIKKNFTTTDQPTKHYADNHNHIPAWILFKNVHFNNVIDLFTFLTDSMKEEIINDYSLIAPINNTVEIKAKNLKKMLTIIRKYRNKIAHNAKVLNYQVESKYEIIHHEISGILPNSFFSYNEIRMGIGKTDLFSMIFSILVLLDHKVLRFLFLQELIINFSGLKNNKYGTTYLNCVHLPLDIEERLNSMLEFFKI